MKLIAAEKSSVEQAVRDGVISPQTAIKMIDEADRELDNLTQPERMTGFTAQACRHYSSDLNSEQVRYPPERPMPRTPAQKST